MAEHLAFNQNQDGFDPSGLTKDDSPVSSSGPGSLTFNQQTGVQFSSPAPCVPFVQWIRTERYERSDSGSSPERCSMLEWCNWQSRWSQKPVPSGDESSNLSSSTKFVATEGAGEWSPSRFESGGLVLSQWGSIPRPGAKSATL